MGYFLLGAGFGEVALLDDLDREQLLRVLLPELVAPGEPSLA